MVALLGGVRAFRVPAAFRADNSSRAPNARRPGRRAAKLLGKIKVRSTLVADYMPDSALLTHMLFLTVLAAVAAARQSV